MDLFYVKGKRSRSELVMTLAATILLGVLALLLVSNHTAIYSSFAENRVLPPAAVIPVIWGAVLVCGGVASYRVKLAAPSSVSHLYYAMQLLTGFSWVIAFLRFGAQRAAFIIAVIYLFFSVAVYFEFDKNDKKAGFLALPAAVWAVLSVILNFYIWR